MQLNRRIRSEAVHLDLDKSSVEESRPELIHLFHCHTEFNGHLLEGHFRFEARQVTPLVGGILMERYRRLRVFTRGMTKGAGTPDY